MGVNVEVWDEACLMGWEGAEPSEIGEGGLTFDTLLGPWTIKGEEFKLLQYVDFYGLTIFNWAQIPTIIEDLERLRPYIKEPVDQRTYDRVRRLAQQAESSHTFLVFIGD